MGKLFLGNYIPNEDHPLGKVESPVYRLNQLNSSAVEARRC